MQGLTWDWPVTGVLLFSCSSPSSPSLYSVTVCQEPSLILTSLTMMATPVPQLNLRKRRRKDPVINQLAVCSDATGILSG